MHTGIKYFNTYFVLTGSNKINGGFVLLSPDFESNRKKGLNSPTELLASRISEDFGVTFINEAHLEAFIEEKTTKGEMFVEGFLAGTNSFVFESEDLVKKGAAGFIRGYVYKKTNKKLSKSQRKHAIKNAHKLLDSGEIRADVEYLHPNGQTYHYSNLEKNEILKRISA